MMLEKEEVKIEVGTPCTECVGTDRYPAFVIKVSPSGKTITAQFADAKPDTEHGYDYYTHQVWVITPDPEGATFVARQHKNGRWYADGTLPVYFGYARKYDDPCF